MAIKKIIKLGDPLLRKKSLPIEKYGTKSLEQLEIGLKDTLIAFRKKYGYGRGISAVQIGKPVRAIYIKSDAFEGMLCDPKIVSKSSTMFWTWDSCFSADAAFFVQIERHLEIEVEYCTKEGTKKRLIAKGDLSELLQHEIDHLDGILFIDYLDKDKKRIFMREIYESLKDEETFL